MAGQERYLGGKIDVTWYWLGISSGVEGDNALGSDQHSSLRQGPLEEQ